MQTCSKSCPTIHQLVTADAVHLSTAVQVERSATRALHLEHAASEQIAVWTDRHLQNAANELHVCSIRSLVLQAVSATALSPWAQYPPRLAVAVRVNKRNARVMVFEVLVGADAGSPFGSSALCLSQTNLVESLTIKVGVAKFVL